MIHLLMGAPGAGKGTQGDMLVERCGFVKLSTGDILRKHIADKTDIGKKIESVMASGSLVSDDLLIDMVRAELSRLHAEAPESEVLLDGFPRTVEQAVALEGLLKNLDCGLGTVIFLDVSDEDVIKRLCGRRVCRQCGKNYHVEYLPAAKDGICDDCGSELMHRDDDKEARIKNRLGVFRTQTSPVLDFYRENGHYVEMPASGSSEDVFSGVLDALEQSKSP
ncbi:MAG: adenylate kinase [Zetaproteobacteria bacterium]|nr:adenylate kinase [Zetaproteobacteria bacterium]